jgi:CheY-like chemotaxis protein
VRVRRQVVTVPRILVADDNTNIQKMVVLAFEERGVDVVAVGNGEAAVRRIPDANPDLILADVFMPVRNGYEVCEFVKKDTRFAHVPVILLVGAFDPLDEKEARRVGADGVLKKPFVPPDPLIAMVMSALEKNPKVAAELAKAREVPVAPPPPPVLEIPAKAEPKPLPDFPEPSAEEAAAIYGFGKGVRSLDDEPEEEKARGPKAPAAQAEEEEDDDFDGASTSADWRRTGGMDFDIPANTAVDPAYSYGKDLAPITFPSEKDVPPKRIHVRDEEISTIPAVPLAPLAQKVDPRHDAYIEEAQSFAPYGMKLSAEPSASQDAPAAWHESPAFQSAASHPASVEEVDTPASTIEPPVKKVEAVREEVREEPTAAVREKESILAPTPTSTSANSASKWTDLSAPPSEYPEGSWMAETPSAPAAHPSVVEPVRVSEPIASAPAQSIQSHEPVPAPAPWAAPPAPAPASTSEAETEAEERPRKKSWFADAIEAVREVVHGGSPETMEEPLSSSHAEPAPEPATTIAPDVARSSALVVSDTSSRFDGPADSESKSHVESQLLSAPADAMPSRKDPALDEPPAAHVTPEPLLVRDESVAASGYGSNPESIAPLQSFPLPGAVEPVNGEPAADLVRTNHEEVPAFAAAPDVSATKVSAPDDSSPADFGERIPTAPPPSREALSGIPFLMPTAAALESVSAPEAPAAPEVAPPPAPNVDEMVQKVLARLEPQLHELLSKSLLKPLVENMLQNELAKKEK